MKRAQRRHHNKRMKRKARELSRLTGGNFDLLYNHLAHCSDSCCGNPRRHESDGRTLQEIRAEHSMLDQIDGD